MDLAWVLGTILTVILPAAGIGIWRLSRLYLRANNNHERIVKLEEYIEEEKEFRREVLQRLTAIETEIKKGAD